MRLTHVHRSTAGDPAGSADLAEQFLQEHAERSQRIDRLYVRLGRVDDAVGAWDDPAAWTELPDDMKSLIPQREAPILSRDDLLSLRRTILAMLANLGER